MSVKAKVKSTKKPAQKFIRINVDETLDNYLSLLERDFPLLSRSDIVKMMLSQAIVENLKNKSMTSLLNKLKITNPVKKDLTEQQMFDEWEKFRKEI